MRSAALAHDLNNLLGAIANNAIALVKHPALPVRLQSDLAALADAAAAAADLARQMLRQGPLWPSRTEAVGLADLIRPLLAVVEAGAAPGVELRTEVDPETVVLVDPPELARLVLNVLINATEALPNGGRITVSARPSDTAEGPVQLTVTDTGPGMTPEVLSRIFDLRFSTKAGTGPRGLGLAGAPAVMERMGGTLHVRSDPGTGTVVTMTLPRPPGTS